MNQFLLVYINSYVASGSLYKSCMVKQKVGRYIYKTLVDWLSTTKFILPMFCAIQNVAIHSYIGFTALQILIINHDKSTALPYAMYMAT